MGIIRKYIGTLYFTNRFYGALAMVVLLFVFRFFIGWLGQVPFLVLWIWLALLIFDYLLLYGKEDALSAVRTVAERLSNGDENGIRIYIRSDYPFKTFLEVIDEIPYQFQARDKQFKLSLNDGEEKFIEYFLKPLKRGEYEFGHINVFAATPARFLKRRYKFGAPVMIPVYPSFLQMRKYQLMAVANRLSEIGVRKIRRLGHSMEFEQIREYVRGDDIRTINWKATARKAQLMVNSYTDERSQQIYCVIDKGRVMKMPFEGMTLLDYAINASLILLNVALLKQDKAGLVTFAENISGLLKADKKATQMNSILEMLYNQRTRYLESDYEKLYSVLKLKVTQRSLVILFTNFETMTGLERQMPYLRGIASNHLLLVVFFENSETRQLIEKPARDIQAVYTKTIAEKFVFEKKLIVKELEKYGILSILTAPQNVTVNTLNKYLEIKSRNLI